MKKAPLIYTVGMIQFPRIPDFERFIERFMESIRKDYPLDDCWNAQSINAQITPEGIKMEPVETKLWQFTSIDRKWGYVLNEQALFFHTADYQDFESFSKRFETGIIALAALDNIDIKWMNSVGIRYVNMIVPHERESIKDYLKPWLIPAKVPELDIMQGIHSVRYKTNQGGMRVQALFNPTFTLPPELNSPFLVKNGWIKAKPSTEFSLIDIDHSTTWITPKSFDITSAFLTLAELKKVAKTMFDSIGTPKAMKFWK